MKKKLSKAEKKLIKMILGQQNRLEETRMQFYPNGAIADFKFPVFDDNTFKDILDNSHLPDKDDKENILQIRQNVLEGKKGNIEVHFDKGMIQSGNDKFELANTIAKVRIRDAESYVYFKTEDRYAAQIFMEAATNTAILVLGYMGTDKGSEKNVRVARLDEFYLLGLCNGKEYKEGTGIMVGYEEWGTSYIYCELVGDILFEPIEDLLLAVWLQGEWEEAKIANKKI